LTRVLSAVLGLVLALAHILKVPHTTSAPPARRFSQYPQELTLRLEGAARLAQVQLLSHEYKIAAKVELLVGTFEGGLAAVAAGAGPRGAAAAAVDPAKASWRRLGFLSFDSNERSSFTARELKSVALSGTPAHLLRLVFHRCHANAANIHSQVGVLGGSGSGGSTGGAGALRQLGAACSAGGCCASCNESHGLLTSGLSFTFFLPAGQPGGCQLDGGPA
jgi:hypothetical protein